MALPYFTLTIEIKNLFIPKHHSTEIYPIQNFKRKRTFFNDTFEKIKGTYYRWVVFALTSYTPHKLPITSNSPLNSLYSPLLPSLFSPLLPSLLPLERILWQPLIIYLPSGCQLWCQTPSEFLLQWRQTSLIEIADIPSPDFSSKVPRIIHFSLAWAKSEGDEAHPTLRKRVAMQYHCSN